MGHAPGPEPEFFDAPEFCRWEEAAHDADHWLDAQEHDPAGVCGDDERLSHFQASSTGGSHLATASARADVSSTAELGGDQGSCRRRLPFIGPECSPPPQACSATEHEFPRHREPELAHAAWSGGLRETRVDRRSCDEPLSEGAGPAGSLNRGAAGSEEYPAHRAAFNGETQTLLTLTRGWTPEQQAALDPQGNTVLHVAVVARHVDTVEALLNAGWAVRALNARRWTALQEAVALGDRACVAALHGAEVAAEKAALRSKRAALLQTMRDMPDLAFKLKWELGSPVFGLVLKRYAPHDTYEVYKRGTRLRVEGSLMGINEKSSGLIPEWKRGHFSLLFDGAPQPAQLWLLDHHKCTTIDLAKEKKRHKPDLDTQVSMLLADGAGKAKLKACDFKFQPVKTWLGHVQTEKLEGWRTQVYEAQGKVKAVTVEKAPFRVPMGARWEDYLALEIAGDQVSEVFIDPLHMGSPAKLAKSTAEESEEMRRKRAGQARRLTGRCWMAEGFPMSLRQLLPVLDVIGSANKHLARVAKFLTKYGDLALFPVKLQVPLLWTVYALVTFREFREIGIDEPAAQDAFYERPVGYRLKDMHESSSDTLPGEGEPGNERVLPMHMQDDLDEW